MSEKIDKNDHNDEYLEISIFRQQLRIDVEAYIHNRTKGQLNYLALKDFLFDNESLLINAIPQDSKGIISNFGKDEYRYLVCLIESIEKIDLLHYLRDQINLIYQEMPKYFSLFFPIVLLSDKLKITLRRFSREKLMETEIEIKQECLLSCNEKIKNLTEEYRKSVKICEDLSKRVNQLSSISTIEKVELSEKLESVQTQCDEYRIKAIEQKQTIIELDNRNSVLQEENNDLRSQLDSLTKTHLELQDQLEQLHSHYTELCQNYEKCPIKNDKELDAFEQRVVDKILNKLECASQVSEQGTYGAQFFSHSL